MRTKTWFGWEPIKDLPSGIASLTVRERELCECVISGMLNKQIATKLNIAERTVKAHRAKVMEKFGVKSLPDLVRHAEKAGISLPD